MRTPLLAGFLALLIPACIGGEIEGVDDQGGGGEGSGSDMGSGSGSDIVTPRVSGSFDRTMITTELAKQEMVTLTLVSENGFAGDVTLAAKVVDGLGADVPGVTVEGPPSATLMADGTATATYQITVPMNATGTTINGAFNVDVSSTAGTATLTSMLTIDAVYTVDYIAGTGVDPGKHTNAQVDGLTVKRGAILRFHNSDVIEHVIFGDQAFTNYHENIVSGGAPGRTYEINTANIPPGSGRLGCYNHGPNTYSTYTVE
jgi:hypothetical protein